MVVGFPRGHFISRHFFMVPNSIGSILTLLWNRCESYLNALAVAKEHRFSSEMPVVHCQGEVSTECDRRCENSSLPLSRQILSPNSLMESGEHAACIVDPHSTFQTKA